MSNPLPPPEETRFKPGESGNPKGREKGSKNRATIARMVLETKLDAIHPKTGKRCKMSIQDLAAFAVAQKAAKGDVRAFQELMDSAYGKNAQPMEHAGAGGVPLEAPIINVIPIPGGEESE